MEVLNPNCSEAVFRIDISKYKWGDEENKIFSEYVIKEMEDELQYYPDEIEINEYVRKVNLCEREVFGTKYLLLSGELPYHKSELLLTGVDVVNEKTGKKFICEVVEPE